MISNQERSQIKALLQSPVWASVQHVADEYCAKIKEDSPLRESEWETLKSLLTQEGKIEGIKSFIGELFNFAQ